MNPKTAPFLLSIVQNSRGDRISTFSNGLVVVKNSEGVEISPANLASPEVQALGTADAATTVRLAARTSISALIIATNQTWVAK